MDTTHPEDAIRKFVLTFNLADGKIKIDEPPIRNSGIIGGKFLGSQLVWKPDCNPNTPEYYAAKDIYIGATLNIYCHRFKVISCDLYVYRYMKEHPELFTPDIINDVRNYHLVNGNLSDEIEESYKKESNQIDQQQNQPEPDNLSTFENCLKRVHIVENDKGASADNAVQLLDQLKSSDNTDCPYTINKPIIEQFYPSTSTKSLDEDKCNDRYIAENEYHETLSSAQKCVRFDE